MDPTIVYETTLNPITVRRSDDGGATWQALDLPPGSNQAIDIEIFPSPLDAHTAFLTVTVNLAYGQGTNGCPSSARASVGGATHGGILASGQVPCGTTYRTTDEGQNWKAMSSPSTARSLRRSLTRPPTPGRPSRRRARASMRC